MNATPRERPLSAEELERLFDEAAREVVEARAAGKDVVGESSPELLEELRPAMEALKEVFGENGEKLAPPVATGSKPRT